MNYIPVELSEVAAQLDAIRAKFESREIKEPLQKLEDAANDIKRAWSGSWLGYHSRVYYRDFQTPPPGAHFSQEWGSMEYFIDGSTGEWCEYDYDVVQREIYRLAGQPDLNAARALAREARSLIADKRLEMVSLISAAQTQRDDPFLSRLTGEIDEISVPNASNIVSGYIPRGQFISRDTVAIGQGFQSPPHLDVWADVMAIRVPGKVCETLSQISTKAAAHLARKDRQSAKMRASGDKVFIGHGRSVVWRDLKDFVQDRLGLSLDEFNRIPIAGITNIARLSQMLDEAAIAFIILTAEDELADGKLQARMNVVHEAGLFQGRLGFTRSIILLE